MSQFAFRRYRRNRGPVFRCAVVAMIVVALSLAAIAFGAAQLVPTPSSHPSAPDPTKPRPGAVASDHRSVSAQREPSPIQRAPPLVHRQETAASTTAESQTATTSAVGGKARTLEPFTAVVGFSFGIGPRNTPGATNVALAELAADIISDSMRQRDPLPASGQSSARSRQPLLLLQWEIAVALNRTAAATANSGAVKAALQHPAHVAWPVGKHYLSTAGVLRQYRPFLIKARDALAEQHGAAGHRPHHGAHDHKKGRVPVFLLAHRDHFPRCKIMVERAGYRVVNGRPTVPDVYDPHSTQPWTRSRRAFVAHEKAIGFAV